MMLKVIGSGLGRTGTMSLKLALEQLGLGPCHHMVEVFKHPETVPLWVDAARGAPDWDAIFDGYESAVDYPAALYWKALAARYPDAKVIHTVRDPDAWFDSTQATIFSPTNSSVTNAPPGMKDFFGAIGREFGAQINDRAFMTDYFRRWTADVEASLPAGRLLVYEAGQGWAPLCAFLDVAVPDTPYPSANSKEEFIARSNQHRAEEAAAKA